MAGPDQERALRKYRQVAASYNRRVRVGEVYRRRAIEKLEPRPGEKVIDAACGTGLSFAALEDRIGDRARDRVARERWENVTLLRSAVEDVKVPGEADAALLVLTHDVLRSDRAIENLLARTPDRALRAGRRQRRPSAVLRLGELGQQQSRQLPAWCRLPLRSPGACERPRALPRAGPAVRKLRVLRLAPRPRGLLVERSDRRLDARGYDLDAPRPAQGRRALGRARYLLAGSRRGAEPAHVAVDIRPGLARRRRGADTRRQHLRRRKAGASVVGALAVVVIGCGAASPPPAPPASPPDTRAPIPAEVQAEIHATLHAVPRFCNVRRPDERGLERRARGLVRYYRRYPSRRFRLRIDDESGSTLSVLLVVRQSLNLCGSPLTESIDRVLPPDISRALTPPRGAR